nr:hypothetical protein [uncultured Flavobacterium sp.]
MKNKITIIFFWSSFFTTIVNAQISTGSGGAASVLPNSSTTNTNVGIGTTDPTAKLEVIGNVKGSAGIFSKSTPNGSVFTNSTERNNQSLVLSAGSLLPGYPVQDEVRMLRFYDFPQSNINIKPLFWFSIEDKVDSARFRVAAETGGYTLMSILNKSQQELVRVFEDGNDNIYMDLPKPNSRIVIGGWGDYLPEHKFVVRGSAKIEGNILTDANIGIGTSNFTDGADTYRLSVKGKVRAEEVKVYNTWADYVFNPAYQLPSLKEVENYIAQNGHLPNVPSAKEITEKGLPLGEMAKIQQEKIEELTLYLIQQNKELEEQKQYLIQQNKEMEELKAQVKVLLASKK